MRRAVQLSDKRSLTIYIVTVLIFYTSGICFAIVYQETKEVRTIYGSDLMSSQIEIVFFSVAGIAYLPIALWIYRNRKNDVTPYVIALTSSLVLVLLYIAYKTIIPSIDGQNEDSGALDILGRILQVAVIIAGSYGLYSMISWRKKTLESLR